MNGSLRIDVTGLNLEHLLRAVDAAAPAALGEAGEHIRAAAAELTPIETGRLVGSATVTVTGDQAAISYDGPYARYQHERLDLRHEHGQAKFLEQPLATESNKAIEILAHRIHEAL